MAEELIGRKLAACVNILASDSVYAGEGPEGKQASCGASRIEKSKEAVVIIKTRKINFKKVEKFISKNHSYKIPCVIGISARKVNKKYFHWIKETLK